jgi:spore coat polysaccharide biosynthesis protein SpsF
MDVVVRLGADSPLIDWEVINDMLQTYKNLFKKGIDVEYLSNTLDRSYPLGLDAEIFKKETFLRIDEETKVLSSKERVLNEINVIPYLHQHKDRFNVFSYKKDFDYSHLRWTLDTPEDFELIKRIYESLYHFKPVFLMRDVLALLEKNPEWSLVNAKIVPKSGFWTQKEQDKLKRRLTLGEGHRVGKS